MNHTVIDISPAVGKISPEFQAYLDAMKDIDDARVMSRKEADTILQKTESVSFISSEGGNSAECTRTVRAQDLGVRQFLLTNLDRSSPSDPYRFRLPLQYLANAIGEIGNFPYQPGERVYEQPSLFLKGAFSLLSACVAQLFSSTRAC